MIIVCKSVARRTCGKKSVARLLCLLMVCMGSPSCSGYSLTGGPRPLVQDSLTTEVVSDFVPFKVNSVVVVPFEMAMPAVVSEFLLDDLSSRLESAFDLGTTLELLNIKSSSKVKAVLQNRELAQLPLLAKAKVVGRRVGAQGALCGVVNKYVDSDGSRYGATTLAGVQFKLWLVDPKSGKVLWTAIYDKSNQPLSENLFVLRKAIGGDGVSYKRAGELIDRGFADAAKALEKVRSEYTY